MAGSDALFLLIKSLSPSEKALVRQGEKGESAYLALFDAIGKQPSYDERKVKKKLQQLGHDINFAFAKNYLTKHILRTLRENETSGRYSGPRTLHEVELLMRRQIPELAQKTLSKAMAKALADERWHDFLQLSSVQLQLLATQGGNMQDGLAAIEQLNGQRRAARSLLDTLGQYEDLYHAYRPLLKRKQHARNELDLALAQDFARHPLLQVPAETLSTRAQRLLYMCHTLAHTYMGDYTGAHAALQASVRLYEAHSFLREDHPEAYFNELWRLGGYHIHVGDHAATEDTLTLLRQRVQHPHITASDGFEKYARLLLSYALTAKRHARAEGELQWIEDGIQQHAGAIAWGSQATLVFLIARFHLEQKRLRDAKRWLNHILDHPARGEREDITSLARILLTFIYLDEGDGELVESQSKATRKYLQRRDALHGFERRILAFLDQNAYSGPDRAAAWTQLHADLKAIFQNPLEANAVAYFDILGWVENQAASSGN